MVFFPECLNFFGTKISDYLDHAETIDGESVGRYRNLAKKHRMWLSLGSLHLKYEQDKITNTHILIDEMG